MDHSNTEGTPEENDEDTLAVEPRRIDRVRQRRTRRWPEMEYELDRVEYVHPWMSPEVQLEEAELDGFYRRVLDSLKPRARLVFIMVRELGLSYGQVAILLRITKHAAHGHVTDVQQRFRLELQAVDVDPPPLSPSAELPSEESSEKIAPALYVIRGSGPRMPRRPLRNQRGVA